METILENIVKGREADDDKFVLHKVDEIREALRNTINEEMKKKNTGKNVPVKEKKRKVEEKTSVQKEKEGKEKSRDKRKDGDEGGGYDEVVNIILNKLSNELDERNIRMKKDDRSNEGNRDEISNKNSYNEPNIRGNKRDHNIPNVDTRNGKIGGQQRKPCYNHFNTICYYGSDCRFDHPRVCESWSEMGSCPGVNGSCEKPHPMLCRSFSDQVDCQRQNCKFLHPRLQKSKRHKAQSTDSGGSHGGNPDNTGYPNDRYRTTQNRHRREYRKPFLHHQGGDPYKRKPFPPRQGKRPYMEGRKFLMREDLHREILKEIVREEMELMRGVYPEKEVTYRIGNRENRARYCV